MWRSYRLQSKTKSCPTTGCLEEPATVVTKPEHTAKPSLIYRPGTLFPEKFVVFLRRNSKARINDHVNPDSIVNLMKSKLKGKIAKDWKTISVSCTSNTSGQFQVSLLINPTNGWAELDCLHFLLQIFRRMDKEPMKKARAKQLLVLDIHYQLTAGSEHDILDVEVTDHYSLNGTVPTVSQLQEVFNVLKNKKVLDTSRSGPAFLEYDVIDHL